MKATSFTPREIVSELDKYIVGQREAKRAVAVALRNRWRRQQVPERLRDEIAPKNIIMIGPTGVGKTEIARRLARLAQAPFLKVEASKFTEVGYVGRDVESMVRDLMELGVNMVRQEQEADVQVRAEELAEERLLDLLLPSSRFTSGVTPSNPGAGEAAAQDEASARGAHTRERLRRLLRLGELDGREVDVEVDDKSFPVIEIFSGQGMEEMDFNLKDMFGGMFPQRTKKRRVKIPEAFRLLVQQEAGKLIDMDEVKTTALKRVEQTGIIFLDELDKIAGRSSGYGPDVSREGVQRDILPIVEGSSVNTKYGVIRTDHILFIAAGAFHMTKPSDLIPELQGRFPIRVNLDSLGQADFVRILTEPENALTRQYQALLATEAVRLEFTPDAIEEMARLACLVNERTENIGARRLHTIMERMLEEISFDAPERGGSKLVVDAAYVNEKLKDLVEDEDLSHYVL